MTFREHIRMSCLGTLPGGEVFSFGVNLDRGGTDNLEPWASAYLEPNKTVWNDLRDDVVDFWALTGCSSRAVLRSVKFAPIGPDGRYTGPPVEREVGSNGAGIAGPSVEASSQVDNQRAWAITLHTAGDIGRVKGRFYLPMPTHIVGTDGRVSEGSRDYMETQASTFISNINNESGLDVLGVRVVVASQGRHNKDGSVKLAPANYGVQSVSVGRVFDTMRSRRNKLSEFRGTPTAVSQ